jgi:cobalt-zinc-cadmium efflux system outer membrane protein
MNMKHVWIGLGLVILAGCRTGVRSDVDGMVCTSASRPVDLLPPGAMCKPAAMEPEADSAFDNLRQTGAQQPAKDGEPPKKRPDLIQRLEVKNLPGSEVKPIEIKADFKKDPEGYKAEVKKYFPPLPPLGPDPKLAPGPDGKPLSLADLQRIARTNSPLLRQAASDVKAFQGAAVQAGAYPNPTVGVQSTTHSNSGAPSYGMLIGQLIKTGGKLKLAQAAAIMDLETAQIAYHRAETDLLASVRSAYFGVLVAEESIRANRALVQLTEEVYKVNVEQVGGGEAAPYEPMQVAVFAAQARQALIQARSTYLVAWAQLASALGVRGLPPTQLDCGVNMPMPKFEHEKVLSHVLTSHTEVATALVGEQKARYNLRLAEVTPIPDVTVQGTITNDAAFLATNRVFYGLSATVPVPVWDLNRGAIQQARGALVRAVEEPHRVRDSLTARVADAYERYEFNLKFLELYRDEILPKQVQAFRSAVKRYFAGEVGRVAYTDLIASEQNLVSVIGPYLSTLAAQWQAVADVSNLLQTEDVFQAGGVFPVAVVPDLEKLLQLPCCHPCSPYPNSVVPAGENAAPAPGHAAATVARTAADTSAYLPPARSATPRVLNWNTDEVSARPRLGIPQLVQPQLVQPPAAN